MRCCSASRSWFSTRPCRFLRTPTTKPAPPGSNFPPTPPTRHGATVPNAAGLHVADVHLNADNNRLLAGDPGQGALLSHGNSDLYTASDFGDVEVRLEFMIPRNSNSGVKLNGHYEIQIRDTHGKPLDQLTGDDCGGVYPRAELGPPYKYLDKGVPPRVNSARPAGEWQSLEIKFRAPRFDAEGKKIENARFERVVLNGEVIHENVELKYPTGAAWNKQKEVARGPFQLQGDHGPVAFRKLAIRPL